MTSIIINQRVCDRDDEEDDLQPTGIGTGMMQVQPNNDDMYAKNHNGRSNDNSLTLQYTLPRTLSHREALGCYDSGTTAFVP